MSERWQTRRTLIERARDPNDAQAWEDFVVHYEPFIMLFVSKMVPAAEVEDLCQDVLLRLWKNLSEVTLGPDQPKFRSWLNTVIRNLVYNHQRSTSARLRREHATELPNLASTDLDELVEKEWKKHVAQLVMKRLETCFSGKAIQVFVMTMEGKTVDQISATLDLSRDSVYVLRNRVRSRFQTEVRRLRSELEFGR